MNLKKFITPLIILSITTACQQSPSSILFSKPNTDTTSASKIDSQNNKITSLTAGTLLGTKLSNAVGASLDKADMDYYQQTSQSALENSPIGKTQSWSNPDNGHSGTITPTKTFSADGTYCHEYKQTIIVGGKQNTAYGTACRQPDSTWKIKE